MLQLSDGALVAQRVIGWEEENVRSASPEALELGS
jgi:hypothetical protein